MRRYKATIQCPVDNCDNPVTLTVTRGHPGTRWVPGDADELEDVTGCPQHRHLPFLEETDEWYNMFLDAASESAQEVDEAAYDAHIDSLIDQHRDS